MLRPSTPPRTLAVLAVDQTRSRGACNCETQRSQALTQKYVKQLGPRDSRPRVSALADAPTGEGVPKGSLTLQARTPRRARSSSSVFALIGKQPGFEPGPNPLGERHVGNRSLLREHELGNGEDVGGGRWARYVCANEERQQQRRRARGIRDRVQRNAKAGRKRKDEKDMPSNPELNLPL
jgi:hypothetical protein